ncbi:MAG: low molecular weight phosphotyrosine protein phosphatase [Opitutales bacterium]|jgi:protein-tyrosine phosphatase|nr:low molecular weight phosphotyrosine protein phosphatase [Opitutales bacterium]
MHILFVCWGNICRSPAAEATFRKLLTENGLDDKITCDSAGTIGQHHGNPPDSRMQSAARSRNLPISGTARMANDQDFEQADLILTMDDFNFSELTKLAPSDEACKKIVPFCTYVSSDTNEVPDPYYGGASGFEKVLDLLEDGCGNLLQQVIKELK